MDGIIFDIDGTLWDSREEVAQGWNRAIAEQTSLDIRVNAPMLKNLFGKPMTEIGDILFPELTAEERDILLEHCYQQELAYLYKHPARLYPKAAETLQQLCRDYPLFIVSNCQCGYIECCIESTLIAKYFTDFACFGDTGRPKGETIQVIMQRNHLSSPVYVGDIQGDADACRTAGIPIIHAAYGFGSIRHPIARIHAFSDLLQVIPSLEI